MSMRLTRSISSVQLFDLVDDDDVNRLVCHLDEQPHLINIRDEVCFCFYHFRPRYIITYLQHNIRLV